MVVVLMDERKSSGKWGRGEQQAFNLQETRDLARMAGFIFCSVRKVPQARGGKRSVVLGAEGVSMCLEVKVAGEQRRIV